MKNSFQTLFPVKYLTAVCLLLLIVINSGCLSPRSNISRPFKTPSFPQSAKVQFYIKKVNLQVVKNSWFDFGTETFIPAIISKVKLMRTAAEEYPGLFAVSERAIPLEINLKWATDQDENIIDFNMSSTINGIKFIDRNEYVSINDPRSRRYRRYLNNDSFYCKVVLWCIIKGLAAADKEVIATVYKMRRAEHLRRLSVMKKKINNMKQQLSNKAAAATLAAAKTAEQKKRHKLQAQVENSAAAPPRRCFAFVVGVGHYQNKTFPQLPYADDDAGDFGAEIYRRNWRPSRVKILVNEHSTKANVQAVLEGYLTKVNKNDLIVLFWSGHGYSDPADPEKVYLACYDTDPRRPWTGFRMDRLIASLKEKGARNVIVIADTCHAGKLITRGERGLSIAPYFAQARRENRVPKGWIYMVSADADRKAVEDSAWSNGAFTYCLLQGLRGAADGFEGLGKKDNIVTLRELRAYLQSSMPEETQRVLGVARHPLITTNSSDPQIWQLSLTAPRKK